MSEGEAGKRNAPAAVVAGKLLGSRRKAFTHAVTVDRPREEVYAFWRDFSNLPRFMQHLERVEVLDERTSRWVATSPIGGTVEWTAEIVSDEAGRAIEWRTTGETALQHGGRVSFLDAPGNRGTEVHVTAAYDVPAGPVGVALAKLVGEEPSQQVREDLRHLKQVLEAGEVIRSGAGPSAARSPWQQRVTEVAQKLLAAGGRP